MNDQPSLTQPALRNELLSYLHELEADDPRVIWREDRDRGLASGINEVFHFFFDDHDFDNADVGAALRNSDEVAAICAVKVALGTALDALGDAGDDAFVQHSLWQDVRRAAAEASNRLGAAS
jgi:hypothetical protein